MAVASLGSGVSSRTVELRGLGREQVSQLASLRFGASPQARLVTTLAGAGGNPVLVEELLAALVRDDTIRIHDSVDDLRQPMAAGLISADGPIFSFSHDLVRDAIHRAIPTAARWDLHRAAGVALASAGAPPGRVAQQFAAGARPGDHEAVDWLRRAATDVVRTDTEAAVPLLERASSLITDDQESGFAIEADLVELLAWSGRLPDAKRRSDAVLYRAVGAAQRYRAHRAAATVRGALGDLVGAAEHLHLAADATADPVVVDRLRCAAAGMSVIGCTVLPSEALAVAQPHLRRDDPELVCWSRHTAAISAIAAASYEQAVEHARGAAAILDDVHVPPLGFLIPHT